LAAVDIVPGVVDELAATLARRYPGMRGYTRQNLFRIRQFFEAYRGRKKVSPLVTQLPWTHHLIILNQAEPPETRRRLLPVARRVCARRTRDTDGIAVSTWSISRSHGRGHPRASSIAPSRISAQSGAPRRAAPFVPAANRGAAEDERGRTAGRATHWPEHLSRAPARPGTAYDVPYGGRAGGTRFVNESSDCAWPGQGAERTVNVRQQIRVAGGSRFGARCGGGDPPA
jgi:hypothetical protein